MTKILKFLIALLLAVPLFAQAQKTYSQAELDQMLAPVALYPDPLLSQVLMASTYPLEVVEAARWTRANPGLQGDAAVRAVQDADWDPSVKSLVAFPQVLQRMDEKLDWTRALGDAFLAQEPHVMDTVQQLRRRAQAAGNLRSNEQVVVQQQGPALVIQPAAPQVVYVPYYDPYVVYGPWWWPAYQPVVWAAWPRPYGIHVSLGFFFGGFDWHHRHVRVVHPHAYYYRAPVVVVNRTVVRDHGRWQHDPHHRRHVDYRAPEVRQRFVSTQTERRELRQEARQAARPQSAVTQPAAQPRIEQRQERREERAAERVQERRDGRRDERPAARLQAQPVQAPPAAQPAAQPVVLPRVEQRQEQRQERRVEQRQERRAEQRQERREERREVPQAQPLPQPRAPAAVAQPQQRMPAAVAPQTPRIERQAQRQEHRQEQRQERREQRQERGQKG